MNVAATIDLRSYDISTIKELENLVDEIVPGVEAEDIEVCGVVISVHQQKLLRLERYMQGEPLTIVKTQWITRVGKLPVIVAEYDEPIRCPNCGDIHDTNQAWYDRG